MNTSITYTIDEVLLILQNLIIDMQKESKVCDSIINENKLSGYKANIQIAKQLGLDKAISIVTTKSINLVKEKEKTI